jgi:hypothetical protein
MFSYSFLGPDLHHLTKSHDFNVVLWSSGIQNNRAPTVHSLWHTCHNHPTWRSFEINTLYIPHHAIYHQEPELRRSSPTPPRTPITKILSSTIPAK